ncbi:Peptidoglycan-binding lysin domain-containing protein [Cinnamomum micranthum f. kanehirae]|uniref:Peptidoglycan-binding lysin domain-containing protein n=1 Tax=Cinnamomum micranthum f. kanehirae TaxID=337451 RepID=A0A443PUV0_9MAGN|nr:Peptidoglycan-binding lysin domain-containing protein [Cinnamomum micranthum f. kanehirae]
MYAEVECKGQGSDTSKRVGWIKKLSASKVSSYTSLSFIDTEGSGKKDVAAECNEVFGVGSGDTCFEVAQLFNLTADEFSTINPNLNCDLLFVGQWLCVDGTVN